MTRNERSTLKSMASIADYHHEIDLRISECAFQAMVIELAEWLGYRVYHEYDSRRSTPGYPDLAMIRACTPQYPFPPRYLLVELKKEKGKLRPDQLFWLTTLAATNTECYVWRPRHWNDIVRILSSPERNPDDRLQLP